MSSDNQYTALGPAAIGFQTDGSNIDVGAQISGRQEGVVGHGDGGPGVVGEVGDTAPSGTADPTGVVGRGGFTGVRGAGSLRGVYGLATNRFGQPQSTTGVLAEGYSGAPGLTAASFTTSERSQLGPHSAVVGVSNAHSTADPDHPDATRGASVVGISSRRLAHLIDTTEPLPLPDPNQVPDGDGTGVWGASGGGHGVHGTSIDGRGGVFESRSIAQLRIIPNFQPNDPLVPPVGDFGDLYLVVYGDPGSTATTEMYLCIYPGDGTPGKHATWTSCVFSGSVTAP